MTAHLCATVHGYDFNGEKGFESFEAARDICIDFTPEVNSKWLINYKFYIVKEIDGKMEFIPWESEEENL